MRTMVQKSARLMATGVVVALVVIYATLVGSISAAAQGETAELRLRLRRDFGFGSGSQMQGRFSLLVEDVDGLARVEFLIDDDLLGVDDEAPFRLQFNTDGYEQGWHNLRAIGYTDDGRALASNTLQRQFVAGNNSAYIVGGVVALAISLRVISYLVTRDRGGGKKRGYGIYGGAICPRCGRPFSRHWWAPNLLLGKLDRCPYCGKWHFSARATPQMLATAENFAEELDAEQNEKIAEPDAAEQLRRRLDHSRYAE